MEYKEALEYLLALKDRGMIISLDNIKLLMESFNRPDEKMEIIHVAGTNGKGSVCSYLNEILIDSGYKVGLYTSPHIYKYNERFKVNNEVISDEVLAEIVSDIDIICKSDGISLTIYEAEVALAILYFVKCGCDFAILETGMGGKLDATNFAERPVLGVLTRISLDHMEFLGATIEEIAMEKAGIIKEKSHYISYFQEDAVKDILQEKADNLEAEISFLSEDDVEITGASLLGQTFNYKDFEDLEIKMLGSYQPYNASLAVMGALTLREFGYHIGKENIYNGLAKARIRGRFELVNTNPLVIIDGAHNEDGAKMLVKSLKEIFEDKKHYFIFGSMKDKDFESLIDITLPLAKKYFTVMPDSDRALSSFDLKRAIVNKGGYAVACGSVNLALTAAINEAGPNDDIVCFGSLYQLGEIIKYFNMENR